mmetsp:Transcript_41964/g.30795  ORF Transcript_41964/g.30795 Transcript_41964/m.30795 type:complete len:138 (-) Transcript_41964:41-454(-)
MNTRLEEFLRPEHYATPFPVVDPYPSVKKAILNIRPADMLIVGATGAVCYTVGWFRATKYFRYWHSNFSGFLGLFMGTMVPIRNSMDRLSGWQPNDVEVARHGALPDHVLRAMILNNGPLNYNLIRPTIRYQKEESS